MADITLTEQEREALWTSVELFPAVERIVADRLREQAEGIAKAIEAEVTPADGPFTGLANLTCRAAARIAREFAPGSTEAKEEPS